MFRTELTDATTLMSTLTPYNHGENGESVNSQEKDEQNKGLKVQSSFQFALPLLL